MKTSESITEIAKALNKVQSHVLEVKETEENPFFKSSYAPLEACWRLVRKPMVEAGLSLTQHPDMADGKPVLVSLLMHTSGQWIESAIALNPTKQDPQGIGAAISYFSRFALKSIFGMSAVGEDKDGNDTITRKPVATSGYIQTTNNTSITLPAPRKTSTPQSMQNTRTGSPSKQGEDMEDFVEFPL